MKVQSGQYSVVCGSFQGVLFSIDLETGGASLLLLGLGFFGDIFGNFHFKEEFSTCC